jgi:glycosyltransferase involved in cell wall biosynthesis
MRILQLINRVPWPLKDGGSIMYYNYIKGYKDAGCDVTIAAFNTTKHYVEHIPAELTSIARIHTVNLDNRVKVVPAFLNLFSSNSYNIERFISKEFEQLLIGLLSKNSYDIIVCESLFMAAYTNTLRSNSNALIVLRQHNVEHEIWQTLANGESNFIKKWYLNLLANRLKKYEQNILPAFDALSVVTQNDKYVFEQMGFTKSIHIAPLGIDLIKSNTEPKPQSLFHIGSMEWEPNKEAITWFVDSVWPKVHQQFPQASLQLAGRKLTQQFPLSYSQGITIKGEVDDAIQFMLNNQIMIVPLLSGSGIRVKILEGMAAGKAIISTTLGAQGIQYTNGKNILIANTENEFYQCVEQLLNNPLLCKTLGAEAQKLIEKEYSNTKVIGEVLNFYKEQINLKQTIV